MNSTQILEITNVNCASSSAASYKLQKEIGDGCGYASWTFRIGISGLYSRTKRYDISVIESSSTVMRFVGKRNNEPHVKLSGDKWYHCWIKRWNGFHVYSLEAHSRLGSSLKTVRDKKVCYSKFWLPKWSAVAEKWVHTKAQIFKNRLPHKKRDFSLG